MKEKYIRVTFFDGSQTIYMASMMPERKDRSGNPLPLLLSAIENAEEKEQKKAIKAEVLR